MTRKNILQLGGDGEDRTVIAVEHETILDMCAGGERRDYCKYYMLARGPDKISRTCSSSHSQRRRALRFLWSLQKRKHAASAHFASVLAGRVPGLGRMKVVVQY
jgi:hypothetical protein